MREDLSDEDREDFLLVLKECERVGADSRFIRKLEKIVKEGDFPTDEQLGELCFNTYQERVNKRRSMSDRYTAGYIVGQIFSWWIYDQHADPELEIFDFGISTTLFYDDSDEKDYVNEREKAYSLVNFVHMK